MGALMRAMDWSSTPLGPPSGWPQSLRTAVSILLNSRYPMFVFWGRELVKIYNDGYRPITGSKHPWAMGRPGPEVWPEIWDTIGPMVERVVVRGESTWSDDLMLFMERNGFPEEVYFTFSYSPIRDESGGVGGLFCACTETTDKVLGERRLKTLCDLAARPSKARNVVDACRLSSEVLERNEADIPFSLLYLLEEDGSLRLVATTGVGMGEAVSPQRVELEDASGWPFADVIEQLRSQLVAPLSSLFAALPPGPWPEPPERALLLPLVARGQERPAGVVVLGIGSRRTFDDRYRDFLALVAGQIATSIANARASEAERKRADALAEIDRAKTAFFSNVSHEFRTPLTLMLGPLQDALAGRDALEAADRERIEVALRNALRLWKLVNTLLDFARIEAGRIEASYEPTDVSGFTASLASVFRSAIERAGLRLVVDCPPLDVSAYVDREMWEKIVFNLLSNAFKFTFEGSIEVAVRRQDDRLALVVRDTGSGIAAEELPHLFERFHRVKSARARTFEGSGIGLALVQELARLHGGTVEVESELGRGSTFTVKIPLGSAHLPADRVAAERRLSSTHVGAEPYIQELLGWLPTSAVPPIVGPRETPPPAPSQPPSSTRVLLADDNTDMREYLSRLLADRYQVEAVADGRAALAAARACRPDLMLIDVMMPELDGFGLLAEVRADERLQDVPVIMLSARAGEEARVEGLAAGADDYLVKPFSARELLARISARIELTRLQRRLQEERTALVELIEQTPVPIAVLRGWDLVFDLANPAYRAVMSGRDILGKPFLEALPEVARQGFDERLREVMRTGRAQVASEALLKLDRRGDGELEDTYWTFIYAPLRGADGEIEGVIAICSEVTEQVRARGIVAQSEARYRRIFETARVSIWEEDFSAVKAAISALKRRGIVDFRGYFAAHPEFVQEAIAMVRIVDVNDSTVRLFGARDKRELLESLQHILVPESEAVFVEELVAIAEGAPMMESEAAVRTLAGETLDVLFTIAFPPEDPELRSVLVTVVDITERKRVMRSLEEADRRKDEFLAILGHELRNPLAAIRSATELLKLTRGEDGRIERARDVLDRQATHVGRLVDGLLEVTRISRGKIALQRQPLDLRKVLERIIDDHGSKLRASALRLRAELPAEPVWIRADDVRMVQVFDNLVTNAIKFTDAPGTITVAVTIDGGEAVAAVRDSGRGIRPELLPHIFEPFQQEAQDMARGSGGLGLGLALVKGLVELHGGRVKARNVETGGAEFEVRLPLTAAAPAAEVAPELQEPARRRVLIVEDNEDSALMLQAVLEMQGHQVAIADGGSKALELLRAQGADVVLCDLGLPGMSGYDVARAIRDDVSLRHTALVALTGYGQPEHRRRSSEAGFDEHLTKPVDLAALNKALARLSASGT